MKISFSTALIAVAFVGTGVLLSSTGCRKKKDTLAKIYVFDSSDEPVADAEVILKAEPDGGTKGVIAIGDTSSTNSSGEAIFNFNDVYQLGQAGVAVLNIIATKEGKGGEGIIKIEPEVTSEESVYLQD